MNKIVIIFFVLNCSFLKSQSLVLHDFIIQDDYNKNCEVIKTCIDSIDLNNDVLSFNLYLKDPTTYDPPRELKYFFKNDTLNISYYSNPKFIDSVVFNKVTKRNDTLIYMEQSGFTNEFKSSCKVFVLKFTGLQKKPLSFVYNNEIVETCPLSDISYSTYNEEKINVIDKDGKKDGKWIDF